MRLLGKYTKMIKNYLPIICCLFAFNAYAQQSVTATIQHQDQTPASFVDVYVLAADETVVASTSTEENGTFILDIPQGQFSLVVEEYGKVIYKQPLRITESTELGLILLAEEQIALKEAVVTGQKKLIEKKVDRLIFHVDQAEGAKGGDALDALRLAPRVKVENDIVSIVGKNGLAVMVDDRLVEMKGEELSNYLKSIKADDIEKIEVITNPPAKYIASGNSGLLNIVLKQGKKDSWNGSIGTSIYNRKKWGYNNNAAFNYRKDKWTVTTNLRAGENNWDNLGYVELYYKDVRSREESNWKGNNTYWTARLGVDYQVTDKVTTGFTVNLNSYDNSNANSVNTFFEEYPDYTIQSSFKVPSKYSAQTNYTTFNYHVIYKPGDNDKKLTFDFDWVKFKVEDEMALENKFYNSQHQEEVDRYQSMLRFKDQDIQNYIFNLDMEHPTSFAKLNYGARFSMTNNKNDNEHFKTTSGTPILDTDISNRFDYKENIAAMYISAEKEFSEKWTAKVGLRYENTFSKGISPTTNTTDKYRYDGLFPTAYLSYTMNESNTFSINIGRRIDRPYMGYLNPFKEITSPYSYSQGNKNIQPAYAYNYELEHAYKDILVSSLYVNHVKGETEYVIITDPETHVQLWTPHNASDALSIGLSETINFKPWRWWKVNANVDVFYSKSKGLIPEMNYTNEGWNLSTRLTNDVDLNTKKTIIANYTLYFSPKGRSGMDQTSASATSNIGLRVLALNKKLQFSLNAYNVFKDTQATYSSMSNDVRNVYKNQSLRMFRFGITYNFGKSFDIVESKSTSEQGRFK